ncbi:MAG: protein kinase [Myxococcota bacterium]|nr:protein kinase [Myxococcota bacterium]
MEQARRYEILSVLGTGGFGTVYRAEQISELGLRREVALKVLHAQGPQRQEAAQRLRDEARFLSNIHHAGIVRVDDLLVLDGRWTMLMELVPGVDGEKLVDAHGALPPKAALALVEATAGCLWAVHQAPGPDGLPMALIHRDMKPANVLLTADGDVKLLDFGVARADIEEREAQTQQAFVMGSLPYMAPERYNFVDSHAGDVYGLGCALFEMLLGMRFGRTRPKQEQHVAKLRKGLHLAWDALDESIREPTLALLAECLAYEPSARPTAEQVAHRALELRRLAPGPSLQQWAGEVVPVALQARDAHPPDALVGRVLVEGEMPLADEDTLTPNELAPPSAKETTTAMPFRPLPDEEDESTVPPARMPPAPPVEPAPRVAPAPPVSGRVTSPMERPVEVLQAAGVKRSKEPSGGPRASLFLGLGVLTGVVAALAGGLLWLGMERGKRAPEPEPTPTQIEPRETPPVDTGGILFQEVDPSELQVPKRRKKKRDGPRLLVPDPTPAPLQPPPAGRPPAPPDTPPPSEVTLAQTDLDTPEEAALGQARVLVTGDVESLRLVGQAGTFGPGDLPPGEYTLFPSFPGGYVVKGPTLRLEAGQTVRFACASQDMECTRF